METTLTQLTQHYSILAQVRVPIDFMAAQQPGTVSNVCSIISPGSQAIITEDCCCVPSNMSCTSRSQHRSSKVQMADGLTQVRAIQRRRGHLIDRTERLANSLGKLCATVASLNAHMGSGKVGCRVQRDLEPIRLEGTRVDAETKVGPKRHYSAGASGLQCEVIKYQAASNLPMS